MKIKLDKKEYDAVKEMPEAFAKIAFLALAICNTFMFGAVCVGVSNMSQHDVNGVRMAFIILLVLFVNTAVYIALALKKQNRSD